MGLNKTPIMDEDDFVEKIRAYEELVKVLEDYIKLLGDELDEVVPLAANHRWVSHRYVEGRNLRNKIDECKSRLDK